MINLDLFDQKVPFRITVTSIIVIIIWSAWLPCDQASASNQKYNRIKRSISTHQQKIEQTKKNQDQLQQNLAEINSQLIDGQTVLVNLQEKLMRQEGHLVEMEHKINIIQAEKDKITKHVKTRLVAYYQTGEIAVINTLFSATTLPELLNLQEYFQSMFRYDDQVLKKFRNQIYLLANAHQAISEAKEKILSVILEIKNQEQLLINKHQEKKILLAKAKTEETLYQQALHEMEKAAAKISAAPVPKISPSIITPVKNKIRFFESTAKRKPKTGSDFKARQGELPPPITGTLIQHFDSENGQTGSGTKSTGIRFQASPGSSISAIYSGTIYFAGFMESYGNLVIIDHGGQYFSLVAGVAEQLKKKGEKVQTGDLLGYSSNDPSVASKGVLFEIRYRTTPVDPLLWIDQNLLDGK